MAFPVAHRSTESLDMPERFVVAAARIYRAVREQVNPPCTCICEIFKALDLTLALPPFLCFQGALSADPAQSFLAEDRGSLCLSTGEQRLLQAVSWWQRYPCETPEAAFRCELPRSIRRVAAPAGRAFALEIAAVGLLLPSQHPVTPATAPLFFERQQAH